MKIPKVSLWIFGLSLLFLSSVPLFGQFVYVANVNDGTVSGFAVDNATGVLTPVPGSPFAAGGGPQSIAVDPAGKFVYTANRGSNDISGYTINPTTGALTPVPGSPFATGNVPLAITVDSTGRFVYAGNFALGKVFEYAIDATTGALTPIPGSPVQGTGTTFSLTSDPTGRFLYAANVFEPSSVSAFTINQSTGALSFITTFPTGAFAFSVAVDPTGKFVYTANGNDNNVSGFTINPATGVLTPIPGSPFPAESLPVFVTADPAGKFLYVVNTVSDSVSVYTIDAATGVLASTGPSFPTELRPNAMVVDSAGRFAYVANAGGANVSGYTISNTTGALTPVLGSPFFSGDTAVSIAITPTLNTPFSKFTVRNLDIACDSDSDKDDRRFNLNGEFTPATGKAIDPAHQAVTLRIGTFSLSIPEGSFKADHDADDFRFRGTVKGVNVEFEIREEHRNRDRRHDAAPEFTFSVEARGADLSTQPNPVMVTLTIGNNTGTESVKRQRECHSSNRRD